MEKKWSNIKASLLEKNPELKKEYDILKMKKDVINFLIKYRKNNMLTQKDFAERINVKQQAISRFEKGEIDPRFSFVARILLEIFKEQEINCINILKQTENESMSSEIRGV
jgi:predicted transcriptional regulator